MNKQQPVSATKPQLSVSAMKQQPTSATKQQVSTGILNRNVEAFIFDRVCIILWAAIGCAIYPRKLGFGMLALADLRYLINFILCHYPDGALNGRLYVKDLIPELGFRMAFRLDWYPGELLVFWIERFVIYLQFFYVMDRYSKSNELDHRILQYSSYIVFTATNVFYLLSAYPCLLQRDPQFDRELNGNPQEEEAELAEQVRREKPEEDKTLAKQVQKEKSDKTAKTVLAEQVRTDKPEECKEELAELHKLKEENEKLISEHSKLNEENDKLYSEQNKLNEKLNELSSALAGAKSQYEAYNKLISQVMNALADAKSQYEAYNKLVSQVMNEGVHGKCKEERNILLNELNAAKATCETYLSLLRNLGG